MKLLKQVDCLQEKCNTIEVGIKIEITEEGPSKLINNLIRGLKENMKVVWKEIEAKNRGNEKAQGT